MLKKEFKRKDVERVRNLVMGKTNASSNTQIGYTKKQINRKEGDVWVENKKTWTIKNGIKQTISKLDSIKKEVFMPLCCPKCGIVMKKRLDKPNYRVHKKCHDCVVKFEHKLKLEGKYKEYKEKLKYKNAFTIVNEIESYLLDAINNTSNSQYVSETGVIERWKGGIDKKGLSKSIKKSIKKSRKYIEKKLKK